MNDPELDVVALKKEVDELRRIVSELKGLEMHTRQHIGLPPVVPQ